MFKELLIKNLQDGILIFVKHGMIVVAIVYAYLLMQNTYTMAVNGNQAALLIREYQIKGWLPAIKDGAIPQKDK